MSPVSKIASELGLSTLMGSGRDVLLIVTMRMIRLLAFGAASLILVLYLSETGMDAAVIGAFMTATFMGDLVSSFVFSVVADALGRRFVIVLNGLLMATTGAVLATQTNGAILAVAAVIGILTPGGGEVGPFRSIEQSAVASLVAHAHRSDIYAWYTFLGILSLAFGSIICGSYLDYVTGKGWTQLAAFQSVWAAYAVAGAGQSVLALLASGKFELERALEPAESAVYSDVAGLENTEAVAELSSVDRLQSERSELLALAKNKPAKKTRLIPQLHKEVLGLVLKLLVLFGVDAFASSLVQGLWLTYYIKHKFGVLSTTLGSIFFVTQFVSGFALLFSSPLTKRYGPVVTMVVTHLPASTLLLMLPIPTSLSVTLAILVVRASTQSMDVAPKHVFLATLVPAEFRTSVFAWTNIVKTLGSMFGPSITGYLTGRDVQWVSFALAGALKVSYDLGILGTFLAHNHHQEH